MKNSEIYAQCFKDEIKFLPNKISFTMPLNDYIIKLNNDILHSIPEVKNHDSKKEFSINDIKDKLQEKGNNCISYLNASLNYLEQNLNQSFNFGNFIDEQVLNSIKKITIMINQFINFINTVKICQFKLMKTFYQITNTLKKYYDEHNEQIIINSFLIDHNQDIILVLSKNEQNKSNIYESINESINESIQIITQINVEQEGIEKYIKSEFDRMHSNISKSLNKLFKSNKSSSLKEWINQLATFFHKELSMFPLLNISAMEDDKIYFDDNKNTNKYFFLLLNISKYHIHLKGEDIMKILSSILEFYDSYICEGQKIQLYKEIACLNGDEPPQKSIKNQKEIIKNKIKEYEKDNKYFYFELIFQKIMRNLVNKDVFKIYHKLLISDDTKEDDFEDYYFSAFDLICFSNSLGYSLFAIDRDFNFCVEKIYSQNARKEVIQKELDIFKTNKSKFIINSLQYSQDDKIFFPYFPLRTIKQCLFSVKSKVNFTLVDKIVMIKEIAIALKDLYSMNQKHGNFSISSIYINSDKDAYLGEIAYDRQKENELTKTPEKVIYRAPEILSKQCNHEEYILADIYSFGLTIYDIITGESVQSQLRKKARFQLYKLLQDGVYNHLFSDKNPIFDPSAFDIKGDSLIGVKEIIEKCTKINPEERFQNFDEIIESIENLAIYENNKEEINYRIDHAKDASTVNCHLTDLIEAYYTSGDKSILKNIENIFDEINSYLYSTNNKSFHFGDDIIKSILEYFNIKFVDDDPDM